MVRTCSVYGCLSTTTLHKGLRFHRFPRDERCQSWVDACQRPDLKDKNMEQLYNLYVCSLHFEKWMYMSMKLKDAAIPVLNLPCASIYPMSTQTEAPREVITEDSHSREIQTQSDDPSEDVAVAASTSSQASETAEKLTDHSRRKGKFQNIQTDINTRQPMKQETEQCFSEHEDDIEEQRENRKRQHETDPLETSKMMKPDNPSLKANSVLIPQKPEHGKHNKPKSITLVDIVPQTSFTNQEAKSGMDNPKQKSEEVSTVKVAKDETRFRIDFMKQVLSSQKEILTVLKSQVLLQNPHPDLLTFLRLVGAKLSRFDDVKRRNIQNEIIDLISKN